MAGGDAADLGRAAEAALRPVIHRVSLAWLGDAVALEQPEPVLELRDAQCEILDFLSPRETRARQRAPPPRRVVRRDARTRPARKRPCPAPRRA